MTQRRLGSLVNELDSMGLLNAKVISMGRYGRTKKIRLETSRNTVREVLGKDDRLGRFIDYEPECLSKNAKCKHKGSIGS